MRRVPWPTILAVVVIGALGLLAYQSRHEVLAALALLRGAQPAWLAAALLLVIAGFVCAGQIYGRVLAALGHHASVLWLSGTAMVAILFNQALPGGSVAAYAFLVASLRRRGFPVASVAMVAGTELLSWNGAVLIAFGYGMGALIGQVPLGDTQVPYLVFLASGSICMSAMNAASFEALYSAFSRMHVQKT